jgi:hypothetical protein
MRSTSVLVGLSLTCAACWSPESSNRETTEQRTDSVGAAYCGNLVCDAYEDNWNCPMDCTACGDGECEYGEDCASCSDDCGGCASHGLCEEGGPLGRTTDWCTDKICAVDSSCCNLVWNQVCIGEVSSICGLDCSSSHPVCETGGPLNLYTNGCTFQVCNVDPYCCNTAWDSKCLAEVPSICGSECFPPHDVCETGGPLNLYTSFCTEQICNVDPYCCGTAWDNLCVAEVSSICGGSCPTDPVDPICGDGVCDQENCMQCEQDCGACNPHDVCEIGDPLLPLTDDCTQQICYFDTYCCAYAWDAQCVNEVGSICGQQCSP